MVSSARIAIVIADDEQPAGVQIKAVDMAVGPNQVGGDRAERSRRDAPRASAAVRSAPVSVGVVSVDCRKDAESVKFALARFAPRKFARPSESPSVRSSHW